MNVFYGSKYGISYYNLIENTNLLQKWVPEIFLGVKGGRPARRADNFTVICEVIV
jgi:hypothetical protein